GDDGIDDRALLVIGVDPIEIALHQLARRKPAGSEGHVNVVDARLYDLERRAWRVLRVRWCRAQGHQTRDHLKLMFHHVSPDRQISSPGDYARFGPRAR